MCLRNMPGVLVFELSSRFLRQATCDIPFPPGTSEHPNPLFKAPFSSISFQYEWPKTMCLHVYLYESDLV